MEIQGTRPGRGRTQNAGGQRRGDPRALSETVATIVEAVRVALERTPPELSADIHGQGHHHRRRRLELKNSTSACARRRLPSHCRGSSGLRALGRGRC